jgi:hypothetical protein
MVDAVGTRRRGDLMSVVRKCEQCGKVDDREQWASPAEAADAGAMKDWTCPHCAWTGFEWVETSDVESTATR